MMESTPSGTILYGRYRIERVLGSGGFGHVYLATDLRKSQQVAVKEYLVTGSTGEAQLEHEARVLTHLHHPNLPAFHEAFNERGRYYMVLSYIEGNDLTDIIRRARQSNEAVPLERILGWIIAVCDAVIFLHSQQPSLIHRDIKPDNIRITSNGTAILVDFGNAKEADGARTLFFIRHQGTPGYAPQEQYPGGSGTDVRSDVYALGATLFFALAAQEPPSVSTRNNALQQGQNDLPSLQEIVANNPPEESAEANSTKQFRLGVSKPGKPAPRHIRHIAQLGKLPPELLNQLNSIIKRAMSMKPKDRFQFVADMSKDLKQVMQALSKNPSPNPPSRPIDPHGTEPDLPMLYEALQAAKEKAEQTKPPADNGSGSSSVNTIDSDATIISSQSASSTLCPRCGNVLLPQASFCPRCGYSLTANSMKPASKMDGTAGNAVSQSQNQPMMRDLSAEQTIQITPTPRPHVAGARPTSPRMPVPPVVARTPINPPEQMVRSTVPPTPSWQNQSHNGAKPPVVQASRPSQPSQPQFSSSGTNNRVYQQPSQANRPQSKPNLVIVFAIGALILTLLAILAIFVLSNGHKGKNGGSGELQRGVALTQSIDYESTITYEFSSAIATAPDIAWLWECNASIPSLSGNTL